MKSIQSKSGKSFKVRSVQIEDIEILLDYINELGKEDTYIFINPDALETLDSESTYVKSCITKIENNKMVKLLVFDGERLIGLGDVTKLERRQGHIGRLGITVRKSHRGDGIGKKLMELIISESKNNLNINQIILGCFDNNQIGLSLYQKLGFVEYGRLKQGILFQGKYIDEILMQKFLT